MVGRDAVSFASPVGGLGASDTGVPFDAYVQLSDFDYVKAIDFRSIYGVKKMSPDNAQDVVFLLFQLTQQRIHKEKIK